MTIVLFPFKVSLTLCYMNKTATIKEQFRIYLTVDYPIMKKKETTKYQEEPRLRAFFKQMIQANSRFRWKQILVLSTAILTCGCFNNKKKGIIKIYAPQSGTYEIYQIKQNPSYHLLAEKIGNFNQEMTLDPGKYLVLADCSHKSIDLGEGEKIEINATKLVFKHPKVPRESALFTLQCTRHSETKSRQHIEERFELFALAGKISMLVNMTPYTFDFSHNENKTSSPLVHEIELAAVRVYNKSNIYPKNRSRYFVSTASSKHSLTQVQELGKWQFLLPGQYEVSLNGSHKIIKLKKGEIKNIETSFVEFKSPVNTNFLLFEYITGSPFQLYMNSNHLLNFNKRFALLPGKMKFNLHNSLEQIEVNTEANEVKTINCRSLMVSNNCKKNDWTCLGKKEILLHDNLNSSFYMQTLSDVPILFHNKKTLISTYSSKGLFYKLPDKDIIHLKLSELLITPSPKFQEGLVTDLVRVEGNEKSILGYSQDINFKYKSSLALIAGNYKIVSYTSSSDRSIARKKQTYEIKVKPYENRKIEIPFYLPENQYKRLKKKSTLIKNKS